MTKIYFHKILTTILICIIAFSSYAQTITTPPVKTYKFTFYAGVGPNFYFNNLVLAKDYVNEYNFSFTGRIMWEPEHNLSLGIESGYNRLYSVDVDLGASNGSVHIVNVAVPIQMIVSMKFFENYYCSFLMGQSILHNLVRTSDYGSFDASTISLGDFAAAIGYKHLISERVFLGTEIKGYYSSKLEDKNIALLFMGGFRF